jgi:integrase
MASTDSNHRLADLPITTEKAAAQLDDKQQLLYEDHRKKLARWALTMGKNPARADGYARETVKMRLYRLDKFYRFIWDAHGFTLDASPDYADDWMRELAKTDNSQTYNAACQKAVKMLFKWRRDEYAEAISWDPVITFSSNTAGTTSRHYFALDTLNRLATASLEYDSLPSPQSVTPEERDSIEAYLAMRFGKPKHAVTAEDWQRADSWKIPAMIHMTIDGGLRNKEVKQAKVSWIDWDAKALRIPAEDAVKSGDPWDIALREQTTLILRKWVEERDLYEKYDDADHLFLTRYGNPYDQKALNRLLNRLCEAADVDAEQASWYSFRRSMVTHLQSRAGHKGTQLQARHKNPETTMRYDQSPLETRRKALEQTFG